MEPWQHQAYFILSKVGPICAFIALALLLISYYHYRFRTKKWWTFFPYTDFNKFEMRLLLGAIAFVALMVIDMVLTAMIS